MTLGKPSSKCHASGNKEWAIFDTIGLEDPDAAEMVNKFIANVSPIKYICFVKSKGRITVEEDIAFKTAKKIFEGGLEENIVMVVTNADNEAWLEDNVFELENTFGSVPMTAVDFPPRSVTEAHERENIGVRAKSMDKINRFFEVYDNMEASHRPTEARCLTEYAYMVAMKLHSSWKIRREVGEGYVTNTNVQLKKSNALKSGIGSTVTTAKNVSNLFYKGIKSLGNLNYMIAQNIF